MKAKEELIKCIQSMTGEYSAYTIFRDWAEASALAMQNACMLQHDKLWIQREERYKAIMNKHKGSSEKFSEMLALLAMAFEENVEDVLGDVYMKSGCYSKQLGQFFTPFHLAYLMATAAITDDINDDVIIPVNEPSVGGGANIIAFAKVIREKGFNPQKILRITAQDLDWLAVYMSYLQFGLLGLDAVVVQGDSLCDPYTMDGYPAERVFMTPARMGVLL